MSDDIRRAALLEAAKLCEDRAKEWAAEIGPKRTLASSRWTGRAIEAAELAVLLKGRALLSSPTSPPREAPAVRKSTKEILCWPEAPASEGEGISGPLPHPSPQAGAAPEKCVSCSACNGAGDRRYRKYGPVQTCARCKGTGKRSPGETP